MSNDWLVSGFCIPVSVSGAVDAYQFKASYNLSYSALYGRAKGKSKTCKRSYLLKP